MVNGVSVVHRTQAVNGPGSLLKPLKESFWTGITVISLTVLP